MPSDKQKALNLCQNMIKFSELQAKEGDYIEALEVLDHSET